MVVVTTSAPGWAAWYAEPALMATLAPETGLPYWSATLTVIGFIVLPTIVAISGYP